MAKKTGKDEHNEFTLQDLQHHLARGIHKALGAIEKALESGKAVIDEVWTWVQTQLDNHRAKSILETHRPDLLALAK